MSDLDVLPAPPPRRGTFFARLAGAIRRQDWFVVALEVGIVVLGVVIGFQVTAWGQGRAERVQERAYLRQLAADLRETGRLVARTDSVYDVQDRNGVMLLHSYSVAVPPPEDSLAVWLRGAYRSVTVRPVMSTAEALVATGDLALIRDDSLRTAITAYIEASRDAVRIQGDFYDEFNDAAGLLFDRFDPNRLVALLRTPAEMDSVARADPHSFFPVSPRRSEEPLDVPSLLAQDRVRALLWRMNLAKGNLNGLRAGIEREAAGLLNRVEAHVEP